MKKSLIAAGLLALMASTGAKAADIVTYQEQPVAATPAAPAAVNWNGVYIGGTIGGSWGNSDTKLRGGVNVDGVGSAYGNIAKKTVSPNSFIGGFYAGYNFQPTFLANSFLRDVILGVETDFVWNSGDGSGKKLIDDVTYKADVRQNWNGATRIRVGYAFGSEKRIMPYFAAGVSYADIRAKGSLTDDQGNSWTRRSTKSRAGWNIGAGIDYVPPIMNDHLVLRAEYRFTDFGAGSMNRQVWDPAQGITFKAKQSVKFNQNDFRVGVAYKF